VPSLPAGLTPALLATRTQPPAGLSPALQQELNFPIPNIQAQHIHTKIP